MKIECFNRGGGPSLSPLILIFAVWADLVGHCVGERGQLVLGRSSQIVELLTAAIVSYWYRLGLVGIVIGLFGGLTVASSPIPLAVLLGGFRETYRMCTGLLWHCREFSVLLVDTIVVHLVSLSTRLRADLAVDLLVIRFLDTVA